MVTGMFGPIRLWRNKYALQQSLVANKEEKKALEAKMDPEELLKKLKNGELAYLGDIENGSILLGQSIGIINSIESVSDIIDNIMKDAEKSIKNASSLVK